MKAFPWQEWLNTTDPYAMNPISHGGMDLRDYFAAKAMAVFVSEDTQKNYPEQWGMQRIAEVAYEMADVMMEVRSSNDAP